MDLTRGEKGGGYSGKLRLTRPWVGLMALTILAAGLRVIGVNKGLWWDEIYFLVITVRRPLAEIVTIFPGDTYSSARGPLWWIARGVWAWRRGDLHCRHSS